MGSSSVLDGAGFYITREARVKGANPSSKQDFGKAVRTCFRGPRDVVDVGFSAASNMGPRRSARAVGFANQRGGAAVDPSPSTMARTRSKS